MPYFKPLNLLYLHVPKTGGMSIEEYFYKKCNLERSGQNISGFYYNKEKRIRVENERSLQHFTYNEIINKKEFFDIEIGDSNKDMKILVSVRNPFERIVSEICWNKKLAVNENINDEEFYKVLYKFLYVDVHDIMDNHKIPQYKFILNSDNLTIKENLMIVKTETLEKDMQTLGYHDFNIHINKNHLGDRNKINYSRLLNKKSIELIVNYYAVDFIHFGYPTYLLNEKEQLNYNQPKSYNATIVTAFINDVNKHRSIENYVNFGKKLLKIPTAKIVFIDKETYENYFKQNKHLFPSTHFILFEITDIYLTTYKNLITNFNIQSTNPEKDTIEYMFVQCNKTEWIRKAIELDIFKTDQFIWIDFGIYHFIKDENVLEKGVLNMVKKSYSKLRISTCKSRDYVCPYDVYKMITWNFAGSVFGGDKKSLISFADIVKTKIIETIETKKTIMWELCFWYLVKDVIPDLYDCYICGHDNRILELY
jgi:hypothetical protein